MMTTTSLPASVRAPRPGLHHAAQPRADGVDAHRPGGPGARLPEAGGLFRRARRGRRGPDRHRRLRAEPGRLAEAVRQPSCSWPWEVAPASPGDLGGACRGRQDLHADCCMRGATATTRCRWRRRRLKAPITPFTPRALSARGVERTIRDFAHCARAGARCRLRRRRGDGLGGLPDQPVHVARAPTSAPMTGAATLAKRMRFAVEIVRQRARGLRPGLHHHLSPVDARPGRRRPRAGTRSSRRPRRSKPPARPSSTPASAGTRRACRPSPPRCRARRSPA